MNKFLKIAAPVVAGAVATTAMAGTGGTEFSSVESLLTDWTEGTVGKILAIGALLVGIAFGLVRQSIVAAVVGISMAIVLNYGPTVIGGIFTATTDASAAQVAQLANGLF